MMQLEKMKAKFRECMREIFPEGPPANQHQHRDMIRVFSMGWLESLLTTGQDQIADAWLQDYVPMAHVDWWPDESWRW
jgi:hypothetical protein